MARISDYLDTAIGWLKWPAAVASMALLPGMCRAWYVLARAILSAPQSIGPLATGLAVYLALWWTVLRRPIWGSFFSTLEHELTHALFAALTGHRVVGLKATWKSGGRVSFVGRGNWLIVVAPYFFPTACLAVLLVGAFVPPSVHVWLDAMLGAALGYHITSTWRETHLGQTDLKQVGYLFSLLFLPTANLLVLGVLLAFAHSGLPAAGEFLRTAVVWPW
jgi:hypothetical protein